MKYSWFAMLLFVGVLAGCGSGGGSATASLKFIKAARFFTIADTAHLGFRGTKYAASTFKMKLIAAYLAEDIDANFSNVGNTAMIYLNPTCGTDIMHCDISAGTAEDGAPMTGIISDFFDFTSDTAANTALNSQGREITAGTYKYARLEFCKYATGSDPNIQWASTAAGVSTVQSFKRTQCTVNSTVFSPALTIAAGGTAIVSLTYDTHESVEDVGSITGATNCSGQHCFTLPTFVPSASTRN